MCEKEKKANIDYIIELSSAAFIDNYNSGKEFKSILLDIQKSFFYSDYKYNKKIREMENISKVFDIFNEVKEKNDYRKAYKEFIEIEKKIFNEDLKNQIEENIDECINEIVNKEISEANKFLKQKDYEFTADKMEK